MVTAPSHRGLCLRPTILPLSTPDDACNWVTHVSGATLPALYLKQALNWPREDHDSPKREKDENYGFMLIVARQLMK
jgi:hypothetical protein